MRILSVSFASLLPFIGLALAPGASKAQEPTSAPTATSEAGAEQPASEAGVERPAAQASSPSQAPPPEGCEASSSAHNEEATAWSCADGTLRVAPGGGAPLSVPTPTPVERVFALDGALWARLRDGRTLSIGALLRRGEPASEARAKTPPPTAPPPPPAAATPATMDDERPPSAAPARNPLRYDQAKLRGGQWTLAGRPFIGDSTLGIALEGAVTWRWTHAFLRVQLDPFVASLATGSDREGHFSFGAATLFGFDHRLFELGLGVGLGLVNLFPRDFPDYTSYVRGIGLTVWQTARAGAIDAVHLVLRNAFVYLDRRIQHLAIDLKGILPISQATALLLRTFTSAPHGYYMGELGMQIALRRNERYVPTLLVSPSIGFVVVDPVGSRQATGGYVGFGIEWRTGIDILEAESP